MNTSVSRALEQVATRADSLLWAAFDVAAGNALPSSGFRMVFPRYSSGAIRASEQEARFFFIHALEESPFLYSVETPTKKLFHQSGKVPSGAVGSWGAQRPNLGGYDTRMGPPGGDRRRRALMLTPLGSRVRVSVDLEFGRSGVRSTPHAG